MDFDILWCPTDGPTSFPCVDCGLLTGNFCDGSWRVGFDRCFARNRVPKDYANASGFGNQRTPLCIAKHSLIIADFVVQSQLAHHSPGLTTGQEFH